MRKNYNVIFYIGWILFIFSIITRLTLWYSLAEEEAVGKILLKYLRYLSYFLCLLACLKKTIPFKHILMFIVIELFLIIVSAYSGDKTMFLLSWIFIGAYKVDSRKCIKIWLLVELLFLMLIVFSSQVGIVEDYIFAPDLRPRHSLGFEWASIAPTIMLHCLFAYIYLERENVKGLFLTGFGIASGLLYHLTDSRVPFIVSMILIIFFLYEKYNRRRWKASIKMNRLFVSLPIICFIFSMTIGLIYDRNNMTWKALNTLLSNRLWLQHNALDYWGISLFPENIELIGYSVKTIENGLAYSPAYNYVDCSYIQVVLYYGLLFAFLLLGIYISIIQSYVKRNDYYTVWIIVFVLLVSLMEPRLINFAYNPFPILFCAEERVAIKSFKRRLKGKAESENCNLY